MVATTTLRPLIRGFMPGTTLGLQFAEQRALLNGVETPISSLLSVGRTGTALAIGDGGVLQSFAAGTPRFSRRTVNGRIHGLLAEGSGANLALYPRDFTQSAWTRVGSGSQSVGVLGMDGTSSASRLQDTVSIGSTPAVWSQSVAIANDSFPVTFSVDLRYVSLRYVTLTLALTGGTGVSGYAVFDLQACQIVSSSGVSCYATPGPLGFIRAQVTLNNNTTGNTSANISIARRSSSDAPGYVDVDFAQLAREGRASSRIYNTSSPGTRAAEAITLNTSLAPLSAWYQYANGTIFVEADLEGAGTDYAPFALWSDANNYIKVYRVNASNNLIIRFSNAGTGLSAWLSNCDAPGFVRLAITFYSSLATFAARVTSNSYTTRRTGTTTLTLSAGVPNPTALHLGHMNGAQPLQGVLKQFCYSPAVLSAQNLSDLVE